jgi:hypothetical protein
MRLLLAACHVAVSKTTARNGRLKRMFRVGLFSAILSASSAHAQTDTPCPTGLTAETACYSGKDDKGAFYLIAKPKNWNGMLVVHAHGGPNPFGDEKLSTSIEYLQRSSCRRATPGQGPAIAAADSASGWQPRTAKMCAGSLCKRLGNRSEQLFTDSHTAVPLRQKSQNFMPSIRMVPAIMTPRC